MKRRIALALIATALLGLITPYPALARSAVYAVAKVQAEVSGIDDEIAAERNKGKDRLRRVQAIPTEMQNKLQAEMAKFKSTQDKRWEPSQRLIDQYNSACGGRQMPVAEVAKCDSWAANIKSQVTPIAEDIRQKMGKKQEDVAKQLDQEYEREMREISNENVLSEFRIKKLTNYKSGLLGSLDKMERYLAVQCPGMSNMEEMKLKCGNVQFDGANVALPECTTEKCRLYDATQRR